AARKTFFFQAEDGIRDGHVTGVQTCALPIFSVSRKRIKWGVPWPDDPEQVFYVWYDALTGYLTGIDFAADGDDEEKRRNHEGFRSEERRVGKESRYWGGRGQ